MTQQQETHFGISLTQIKSTLVGKETKKKKKN